MLRCVQETAGNVMYYVEGTAGNIIFPCVGETPGNWKMHFVQEIIGDMMCPLFQKL
jgi:hypothetical protein